MKDNIFYCHSYDDAKKYKYMAYIISYTMCRILFASNNLRDLKKFINNELKYAYENTDSGIYYSYDKNFKSPIYKLRIEYIDDICVKTETLNFKNKQL